MAKKIKTILEDSATEVKSAELNEMDEIGPGDIPAELLEESKQEEKEDQ